MVENGTEKWWKKTNANKNQQARTHTHTLARHQQYAIKQQIESKLKAARLLQNARARTVCMLDTHLHVCTKRSASAAATAASRKCFLFCTE